MRGHFLTTGLRRLNKHYQSGTQSGGGISYEDVGEDFFFPDGKATSFYKMLWGGKSCYVVPYGSVFFDYYREKRTQYGAQRRTDGVYFQYSEGNDGVYRRIRGSNRPNYADDFAGVSVDFPKAPVKIALAQEGPNTAGVLDFYMIMLFDVDYTPAVSDIRGDINVDGFACTYSQKIPFVAAQPFYQYISPIYETGQDNPTQIGAVTYAEPLQPLSDATIEHCLIPHVKRFGYIKLAKAQFNDDRGKIEEFATSLGCPWEWVPQGTLWQDTMLNMYHSLSDRVGHCLVPRGGELIKLPTTHTHVWTGGARGSCGWSGEWGKGGLSSSLPTPLIDSEMKTVVGDYTDGGNDPVTVGGVVSKYSVPWPSLGYAGTDGLYHVWSGMRIQWVPMYELNKLEYVSNWHL